MWHARTKNDLIIEVWEKLDCEDVGRAEIQAIETVVADRYGREAVDSPMITARLLADEGAYLRHSEIMKLYLERVSDRPYEAAFRDILRIDSLKSTLGTLRNLQNLRKKYLVDGDRTGLRIVRETAIRGKEHAAAIAANRRTDDMKARINVEIVQWFSVWIQTPDFFDDWVALRQRSGEFVETFGRTGED